MSNQKTEAVKILLGNPKAALIKLSIPIILANMAHAVFQLADIIWVSGLGADSIAAVGFFGPLLIFAVAIISGIGVGGGTCISQRIGAKDKTGADKFAAHMFILILFVSLLFIIPLLLLARPLFLFMGAEQTIELTLSYARIMVINFFFQFLVEGAATIFRSEGDTKRAMKIYLIGIVLNSILDPIVIYSFGLGVAGAAWASLVSMFIVTIICVYWLLIKRITYVSIRYNGFGLDRNIVKDVLKLGVPISVAQFFWTVMILVNTKIVAHIGGTDGVAVYQGGLRFWNLTLLPIFGIASALTTIIGAAWGAKNTEKIKEAYHFSLKLTLIIEGILMSLTFFGAPFITIMYTWSKDASRLANDLVTFFRVIVTINLAAAILFLTESLFVGVGQGSKKLLLSFLRSMGFVVPCTLLLGIALDFGLLGVWTGISIGNWIATIVAIILSLKLFRRIAKKRIVCRASVSMRNGANS